MTEIRKITNKVSGTIKVRKLELTSSDEMYTRCLQRQVFNITILSRV